MGEHLYVASTSAPRRSKAVVFTEPASRSPPGGPTRHGRISRDGAEAGRHCPPGSRPKSAVAQALCSCCARWPRSPGLGVTSMAESGVLLDAHGAPVAPVIAWHDTRDHGELTRLDSDPRATTFAAATGLPLRAQWSLTKHRWLMDHVPAARTAVRRLNIAEWIVRGLGGDEATEQSLASRTGWLRPGRARRGGATPWTGRGRPNP